MAAAGVKAWARVSRLRREVAENRRIGYAEGVKRASAKAEGVS